MRLRSLKGVIVLSDPQNERLIVDGWDVWDPKAPWNQGVPTPDQSLQEHINWAERIGSLQLPVTMVALTVWVARKQVSDPQKVAALKDAEEWLSKGAALTYVIQELWNRDRG